MLSTPATLLCPMVMGHKGKRFHYNQHPTLATIIQDELISITTLIHTLLFKLDLLLFI